MLKLLMFIPCEKFITGEDKLVNIIGVLEAVNVERSEQLPSDALAPLRWHVVTLWRRESDIDGERAYEQRVEIYRPDGQRVSDNVSSITVNNSTLNYRFRLRMSSFPIGVEGNCILKLYSREAGEEHAWIEISEYPILVKHIIKEPIEIMKSVEQNAGDETDATA